MLQRNQSNTGCHTLTAQRQSVQMANRRSDAAHFALRDKVRHPFSLLTFLLFACTLASCKTDDVGSATFAPESDRPLPTYETLVELHNRNTARLDRLWSRSTVVVQWTDENDKRKRRQGEGRLIFIRPDRVALEVGKVGHTLMWFGCNETHYWLFDLSEEPETAYLGKHKNLERPTTQLAIPLQPQQVFYLLGAMPIDPLEVPDDPAVEWHDGGYLIEPPGTNTRMLLDEKTALPRRIDLIDDKGRSLVICKLDDPAWVEQDDAGPGQWPKLATRAEITVPGQAAKLTLHLNDMTDGEEFDQIDERVFDFEVLLSVLKPKVAVDLDEVE